MYKYIIILILLIACKKEHNQTLVQDDTQLARGSQTTFWYTGAASAISGADGIRMDADVLKMPGGSMIMRSMWMSMQMVDTFGKIKWFQWGYGLHKTLGYITIDKTVDQNQNFINPPTVFLNSAPFAFNTKTSFTVRREPNTTKWICARNGVDIEEIDFESYGTISRIEVMFESQSSSSSVNWPKFNIKNISILQNDAWAIVPQAGANGIGINGKYIWGIEGQAQNAALSKGEINFGGSTPLLPFGFINLW